MLDLLLGAHIQCISLEEYAARGPDAVAAEVAQQLRDAGRRPYVAPLSGTAIAAWGYFVAMEEIRAFSAAHNMHFDIIFMSCGSGGACELYVHVSCACACV